MEIAERVQALALKIGKHKADIATEEATKNAFVMPFISTVLGYDVFNPSEVIPEFVTDVGVKKGEKVDYAIARDGQVQILIEVKKINDPLRLEHASQLFRYFSVTNARIAILTNGEVYHFYTDLDAPNKMDSKPYMELNFADVDETLLPELAKLTRESFNLESVLNAAEELKYVGQLKRVLAAQFRAPHADWVRFLVTQMYERPFTQRVRDQFTPLVEKAGRQFLNEQANDRLQNALSSEVFVVETSEVGVEPAEPPADEGRAGDVVTTAEELDGFRVVQAIVCSEVSADRIVARDNKSYFGVLLDDNNRKPIARLWFNRSRKYLGVFDEQKRETRLLITDVADIYRHADLLRKTVSRYLTNAVLADSPVLGDAEPTVSI